MIKKLKITAEADGGEVEIVIDHWHGRKLMCSAEYDCIVDDSGDVLIKKTRFAPRAQKHRPGEVDLVKALAREAANV